jgi:hypothetical protein
MAARDLAELLSDRDPRVLVREHLTPMIEAGELAYAIPNMPRHPEQRYVAPPSVER